MNNVGLGGNQNSAISVLQLATDVARKIILSYVEPLGYCRFYFSTMFLATNSN